MLYNQCNDINESEKERNLYYKYFAGYFFNEPVPGLESRFSKFALLLQRKAQEQGIDEISKDLFSVKDVHVSFDNHAYLVLGKEVGRGEFADIMVYDSKNKILVAIEVKYLSDWNYQKDIEGNAERINKISNHLKCKRTIQCLLILYRKLQQVQKKVGHSRSNYTRLNNMLENRPMILTWEEFLDICDNKSVSSYLKRQFNRTI